jgi:hypothetical protein
MPFIVGAQLATGAPCLAGHTLKWSTMAHTHATQNELSERALALTADMIEFNQADYSAWEWRWRCLCALRTDLNTEYDFTDSIMHVRARRYVRLKLSCCQQKGCLH